MRSRADRRAGRSLALAVALTPLAAQAAPVAVGHLFTRTGEPLEPEWSAAFRAGAEEGSPPTAPSPPPAALQEAVAALQRGEEEYLKARLRAAEKALAQAADAFLGAPETLEAEPAARALLLLAQVQLALGRGPAAERTLERGATSIPDFPGPGAAPPPEVEALLGSVHERVAPTLTGAVSVESDEDGVAVYLGGRRLGLAPLNRAGLPPTTILLRLERAGDQPLRRTLDLAGPPVVVRWASSEARRAALGAAAADPDPDRLFAAGAELEATLGAEASCVGLLTDETHALVVRFSGRAGKLLGGHRAAAPDAPAGWRALGRFCAAGAPGNLDAAAVSQRLHAGEDSSAPAGPPEAPPYLAYGLLGAGALALGAGGYFGWQALEANDRYDAARSASAAGSAADDARSRALRADVSFGLGAALAVGGAVLLMMGPEPLGP